MKQIISILTLITLSGCSTITNFLYRTEYASKIESKIYIDTYTKKPKLFVSKADCYFSFCSDINDMIKDKLSRKNIIITEKTDDADYILNLEVESFAEINSGTAKILKNYMTADLLSEKFFLDGNNNIHESQQRQNYNITGHTADEQMDPLKIGGGAAFGGAFGYLVSHSLKGAGIGAIAALPLAVIAESSTRSTGLLLSLNMNLFEVRKDKVKFSRKILDRKAANVVDESFYNYEKDIIPYKTRSIAVSVTSIYNIENTSKEMFKITLNQILDSTFSNKQE